MVIADWLRMRRIVKVIRMAIFRRGFFCFLSQEMAIIIKIIAVAARPDCDLVKLMVMRKRMEVKR